MAAGSAAATPQMPVKLTAPGSRPALTLVAAADTPDVPKAPTQCTVEYVNGAFELSWYPSPVYGVNGGDINQQQIIYRIKMTPGDEVRDTHAGALYYTWPHEAPEQLTYFTFEITPIIGGNAGIPATTNTVMLGNIVPPYSNDIATQEQFDELSQTVGASNRAWMFDATTLWARVSYNRDVDADAYLMMPPVRMQAGSQYAITAAVAAHNASYPERAELVVSRGNTLEALHNGTVVSERLSTTALYTDGGEPLSGTFMCEEDGVYYVALHACSEKDMFHLYARQFAISPAVSAAAPAPLTDLLATPDIDGADRVTLTATLPLTTVDGAPLSGPLTANIARDGEALTTLPLSGTHLSWEDTGVPRGMHTYSVTIANAAGASMPAEATCYAGLDIPAAVDGATLTLTEQPRGSAVLDWQPVTRDRNGKRLSDVRYNVIDALTGSTVGRDVTPPYTHAAVTEGDQDFVRLGVQSVTEQGVNDTIAYTHVAVVGTPYELPFRESFSHGNPSTILYHEPLNDSGIFLVSGTIATDGYGIVLATDDMVEGVTAADDDNGFLGAFYSDYYAMFLDLPQVRINLGMVSIPEGAKSPVFSLDCYGIEPGVEDKIEMLVRRPGDTQWSTLDTFAAAGNREWNTHTASLDDYRGATLQLAVAFEMVTTLNILLDNVRVFSQADCDIADLRLEAPPSVRGGESLDATVTLRNAGTATLTPADYSIALYADDAEVARLDGIALEPNARGTLTFTDIATSPASHSTRLRASAIYAADEQPGDNDTPEVTVAHTFDDVPHVTDLVAAAAEDGSVTLTWSTPAAIGHAPVTQGFEDMASGDTALADWLNLDLDGAPVGAVQEAPIPGVTMGQSAIGWVAVDNATMAYTPAQAYAGDVCLATVFNYDRSANNDMLISPLLPGVAQTLTFRARSLVKHLSEHLSVMASASDSETPDSYELLDGFTLPDMWTQYAVALPEGTRRFALVGDSHDCLMLLLDDVTYKGMDEVAFTLLGYDLYRDGVRLNDAPLTGTTYTDSAADLLPHTYVLLTLWQEGVSQPSNAATPGGGAAIDVPDIHPTETRYYNLQGQRVHTPQPGQTLIRLSHGHADKVIVR